MTVYKPSSFFVVMTLWKAIIFVTYLISLDLFPKIYSRFTLNFSTILPKKSTINSLQMLYKFLSTKFVRALASTWANFELIDCGYLHDNFGKLTAIMLD